MTATELDLADARAGLNALGRRLDELALSGAEEPILDELLAAMRQAHDGIIGHLAAATRTTAIAIAEQPTCHQQNLQAAA